jgi:acyl-CoA synthetase (NDP forming)
VLVIYIPPLISDPLAVASVIAQAARIGGEKPIAGVFMSSAGPPPVLAGVPCHAFPESAAIALARVAEYAQWRRRPSGSVPALDRIRRDDAVSVVARALARGGGWLAVDETQALMDAMGIPVAVARRVPVAADEAAVRSTVKDFVGRLGGELDALLVQRMVPRGVEMLVGALQDPMFGPLVVCGAGGTLVDLLADTAFRLHPLTSEDAEEMIAELRAAPLLRGYRGAAPADEAALRDVVLRVSALLDLCPEIQELDLNPLTVLSEGACAVDVRVRVERFAAKPTARRVVY